MIDVEVKGTLPEVNTDTSKAMEEIREYMYASVRNYYMTEGNGTWPARRHFYPWPMLRKTGTMFNAIAKESGANYAQVYMPDAIRYAKYHQDGVPSKNLDQRMFMMFQNEDYPNIVDIALKHLIQSVTLTGPTSTIGAKK